MHYGAFALPDTETDTEKGTDTDNHKLTQNLMGISVDVYFCAVWTPLYNSIQPIISVFVSVLVLGSVDTP